MLKSLRFQILALTILPTIIITLLLGVYFAAQRSHNLETFTINRGKTSAEQLSINAQYALSTHNTTALQQLINNTLEESGVRAAGIFSIDKNEMYHAGATFKTKPLFTQLGTHFTTTDSIYTFYTPIILNQFTGQLTPQTQTTTPLGWVVIEYNANDLLLINSRSLWDQFIFLTLSLIIASIIIIKLSNYFINDVLFLNEKIKGLKEGRFNKTERKSSSIEVQLLTDNMDSLFQNLQKEHDEMKLEYEQVYHDEQNAKELLEIQNIELNEAKKEAIAASKSKSDFLANTSHEIRTPLTGIIGFTKLMAKTPLNKQQTEYIDTISESSESLLTIINDILDFSKIEADKLELEFAPLNLRQLLEECLNLFAPPAIEKNVEMILMYYQDVPEYIKGDALRLKQIFSNLLNNAVKFTTEGTIVIRVSLESLGDEDDVTIGIAISDTGIGMTAQQQSAIFTAFTQANTSTSRKYGGTGLGLAIVKNLIELMHGNIKVESNINQGSTFTFTLKTTSIKTTSEHTPTEISYSILLIEPHTLLQQSLNHLLTQLQHRVFLSNDITDGLQKAEQHYIDLIILGTKPTDSAEHINNALATLTKLRLPMILILNNNGQASLFTPYEYPIIKLQKPIITNTAKQAINQLLGHSSTTESNDRLMGLNKSILIVDDNPANIKLLHTLLSDKGINVTTAINGLEAINICQTQLFDLIFMDIQMPIMNGIDATISIRSEQGKNNHTPIIAITAHAMADEKETIMAAGMNDYLTKPIIDDQLDHIINIYCAELTPLKSNTVDINTCLQLANNKATLACEMFTMLCQILPSEIENINYSAQTQDNLTFLNIVHKLHGACCYTGVPQLKKAVQALEQAIKENQQQHYQTLLLSLNQACQDVINWNEQYDITQEISKA